MVRYRLTVCPLIVLFWFLLSHLARCQRWMLFPGVFYQTFSSSVTSMVDFVVDFDFVFGEAAVVGGGSAGSVGVTDGRLATAVRRFG